MTSDFLLKSIIKFEIQDIDKYTLWEKNIETLFFLCYLLYVCVKKINLLWLKQMRRTWRWMIEQIFCRYVDNSSIYDGCFLHRSRCNAFFKTRVLFGNNAEVFTVSSWTCLFIRFVWNCLWFAFIFSTYTSSRCMAYDCVIDRCL